MLNGQQPTRSPFEAPRSHLAPIARPAITDEIVNRLIGLILSERLKPGDRLPSEHSLMSQLSVGRSSLREAIKTLRAIGIVDVVNGRGMFVGRGGASVGSKSLSWELLMRESGARELIEARCLIEAELAALAAERASAEELAAIGRLAATRAVLADIETYNRANLEFHLAVARGAHNVVLSHFMEGLHPLLSVWIRIWMAEIHQANLQETVHFTDEHLEIYEAIRSRDAGRARQAMLAHVDSFGARLLQHLSQKEHAGDGDLRTTWLAWAWSGPESA